MPERPQPSSRSAYRAFRAIATRWMDNDAYGHMNNVVHYSLFDTAVNGWLIDNGLLEIHAGATIGLVVETGCRYFAEAAFPDAVTAGIRVGYIGKSSVRYEVGLFRNEEQGPFAEGFFTHVYVERQNRKPTPIEDGFRRKLEAIHA